MVDAAYASLARLLYHPDATTHERAVAGVAVLHCRRDFTGDGYSWSVCAECRQAWPCATQQALLQGFGALDDDRAPTADERIERLTDAVEGAIRYLEFDHGQGNRARSSVVLGLKAALEA